MKRPNLFSIKSQLIILVLLTICPIVILFLHTANRQREITTERIEQHSLNLVHFLEKEQIHLIDETRRLLQTLSRSEELQDSGQSAECARMFGNVLQEYPYYSNITAFYPDGTPFCSGKPAAGPAGRVSAQRWFREVTEKKQFIAGAYVAGGPNREPALVCGYPVLTEGQQVRLVLTASLNLGWLTRQMSQSELPEHSTLTLVDGRGIILSRYPEDAGLEGQVFLDSTFYASVGNSREGTAVRQDIDGILRLFALHKLGTGDDSGYLLLGIPEQTVLSQTNALLSHNLLWLGFVTLIAVGLGWGIGHYFIINKTEKIVTAAEKLSNGNLQARTGIKPGRDELSQIGRAFDTMGASLEKWQGEMIRAKQELYESRERLSQLARHLQSVQEQERAGIAREIHDEFAQILTILRVELAGYGDRQAQGDERPEEIRSMLALIDRANRALRNIIADLRPDILDILGLVAALEWQVTKFRDHTDIETTLDISPGEYDLPDELSTGLFRIVQESLTNIERHAGASRAEISLNKRDNELHLRIRDNGKGLEEGSLRKPGSFGLLGIKERVESWAGECSIKSRERAGTEIAIRVPLPATEGGT